MLEYSSIKDFKSFLGYLFTSILLSFSTLAWSQAYPLGINPPSINWKQIDTEKVQVIFPEEAELQAQRTANIIQLLYDSAFYSLGPKKKKVSIILQNQNTTSNGFVAISPFRSEFFLTPPQDRFLGTINWLDGLSIHEYRHVQQFVNAKKNVTKLSSFLFGQNGWGVTAGLALPRWFFEGDAVFYETALTNSGRGRVPFFENQVKAMLLTRKRIPSYELASATSLKEFIPNHYNMGYLLTTGMRKKYGNKIISQVVDHAVSYRSVIYPFSLGLRKYTGERIPKFYNNLMQDLKSEWSADIESRNITSSQLINNKKKKSFTNYMVPRAINDSSLIAFKYGFRDINQLVKIDLTTGKEQKLTETGFIGFSNLTLSTNGRLATWAEAGFDPRWGTRTYSNIWVYNLKEDKSYLIHSKSRYFSPAISGTGGHIAAIRTDANLQHSIDIMLTGNGEITSSYSFDEGTRPIHLSWKSENELLMVLSKSGANALAQYQIDRDTIELLTPYWEGLISYPYAQGNNVYFSGVFDGYDNIYRWDIDDQLLYQVTHSQYGAQSPSVSWDNHTLYFSNYTAQGYDVHSIALDSINLEIIIHKASNPSGIVDELLERKSIMDIIPNKQYPTSNLKETKGLINFHSWTPWFLPPNFGLTLESDNIMSTLSADISVTYNTNERTASYGAEIQYGKYFPVISMSASKSDRSRYTPLLDLDTVGNDISGSLAFNTQSWTEDNLAVGITIPFITTWKNFYSKFWVSNYLNHKRVNYSSDSNTSESFEAYSFEVSSYFLKRVAKQQLKPRIGLTWDLSYKTTLNTLDNESYYFQNQLRFFLPGLGKTHSLYVNLGTQKEPFNSAYKFQDDFFYARGYGAIPHDKVNNLAFNYSLPLVYPDIPVGPFLFIKRIKANLFYDRMTQTIENRTLGDYTSLESINAQAAILPFGTSENSYRSFGMELTIDARFMRSLDINTGVRISRILDPQSSGDQLIFDFLLLDLGI